MDLPQGNKGRGFLVSTAKKKSSEMKRCPGTNFTDCDHKLIDSESEICDDCIKSLNDWQEELLRKTVAANKEKTAALTAEFSGATVIVEKMERNEWCDHSQGSGNRYFGLPTNAGLWIKLLEHHRGGGILFFLLLQLTKSSKIESIHTVSFDLNPDGSMYPSLSAMLDSECEIVRKACKEITAENTR